MSDLIPYQDLPTHVPGRVLLASDALGWKNVALRAYHYAPQEVIVPAMRDFMLVGYRTGVTPMQRRFDARWRNETVGPGAASLLTRAQRACWNWREPINVTHVYLAPELVMEVASEAMDCAISAVTLADVLRTDDDAMTAAMAAIAQEASVQGLGGALYVDSLARALIVHLLRRYAAIDLRRPRGEAGLAPHQHRMILDFIEANLAEDLDLKALAGAVGLTPCLFARLFRRSFGKPPHAFVIARRVEKARRLLACTDLPIKAVALDCGFSDQSHLTRLFALAYGVTPAAFRRRAL